MMLPKHKRKRMNSTSDQTLWKWFSKYVRLRDRLPGTDNCRCISCGAVKRWKEMDAGHFVPRDRWNVRYNEQNVNAQCQHCNRFQSGNQFEHGLAINAKYGSGTAEYLAGIAKRGGRFSRIEIITLSDYYKRRVKGML